MQEQSSQNALVLEKKGELSIREIDVASHMGPDDVRIKIATVGVCGSDVHYYTHGRIGPFEVKEPMILGHEASGIIVAVGANVRDLSVGDRVCMEPGVPQPLSRASRLGIYNLDPDVRFWATPPIHGVLTPRVVHPASLTFRLPDNVSFAEGAMVEPFAVGMQAASKAEIQPGDVGLVLGAGPIGIMVAIAALAGGCSTVIVADFAKPKLEIAGQYPGVIPCDLSETTLQEVVAGLTGDWGVDVLFECSGAKSVWSGIQTLLKPNGTIIAVGLPVEAVPIDISSLSTKEIVVKTVFRYAHQYERAIALISSGKVDLKPLISATYDFNDAIAAFERAAEGRASDVKIQIEMPDL
ncbi:NAD(P)-dependent alcohol dehydrogenase [Pararhizobium antarcticum]|uniref:Sulfurtransferase n=1 Tax=Pararhizobium antarcticum TaxID=1798805 RepID=A0A657LL25_9HYPH|nr:NAD(P)-dependent alcohol dehydrogenase [Pararhizobium antarcticum]OJF90455.1 sulfurtransferase [Rhizobium sp. 58]OJF90845.1 sulfurtransferase [Pararhizobium antarcticum]